MASLARPDGNITGLSNMGAETGGKCLELFRDMLPSLRRVGVLANPVDPFTKSIVEQVQLAGRTAGIEIAPIVMVQGLDERRPSPQWREIGPMPSSFRAFSLRRLLPI